MGGREGEREGGREGEGMVQGRGKGGKGRRRTPTVFWTNRTLFTGMFLRGI